MGQPKWNMIQINGREGVKGLYNKIYSLGPSEWSQCSGADVKENELFMIKNGIKSDFLRILKSIQVYER